MAQGYPFGQDAMDGPYAVTSTLVVRPITRRSSHGEPAASHSGNGGLRVAHARPLRCGPPVSARHHANTERGCTGLLRSYPYGISFWACFLFERYACHRPVNQVAAWMRSQGLSVSAGTLASSIHRFLPLFAPLSEAIFHRQGAFRVLHGDETRWRVQSFFADRGSSRAWLWVGISGDAVWFHVDASRSAKAAGKLFGEAAPGTVLVCDRFSAYKKLARVLGGALTLAWCWVHARRDFIKCAAGHPALTGWQDLWLARFAQLFRLNAARLELYDPDLDMERQATKFKVAHRRLKRALDRFFATAARDLEGNAGKDRRSKPLRSLLKHREGLCVFSSTTPGSPWTTTSPSVPCEGPPSVESSRLVPTVRREPRSPP